MCEWRRGGNWLKQTSVGGCQCRGLLNSSICSYAGCELGVALHCSHLLPDLWHRYRGESSDHTTEEGRAWALRPVPGVLVCREVVARPETWGHMAQVHFLQEACLPASRCPCSVLPSHLTKMPYLIVCLTLPKILQSPSLRNGAQSCSEARVSICVSIHAHAHIYSYFLLSHCKPLKHCCLCTSFSSLKQYSFGIVESACWFPEQVWTEWITLDQKSNKRRRTLGNRKLRWTRDKWQSNQGRKELVIFK